MPSLICSIYFKHYLSPSHPRFYTHFVANVHTSFSLIKKPRSDYQLLTIPEMHGDMGFPDPNKYYQAERLAKMLDCCRKSTIIKRVALEQYRNPSTMPDIGHAKSILIFSKHTLQSALPLKVYTL